MQYSVILDPTMKASLFLFAIGFVAALALPIDETRWEMIPDDDGHFHLFNIKGPVFQPQIAARADFPVKFLLYTKANPTSPTEIITGNVASLTNSGFSASRQTRIIVHGMNGRPTAGPGKVVREAYMARGDFNVIVVDWSVGAKDTDYVIARSNVLFAGRKIADLMDFLNTYGLSSNNIYIIGHSLGAHVSGMAGKFAKVKPNTIFGLDTALLPSEYNDPSNSLASTDAEYVQTIHTNTRRVGLDQPLGAASFYPNWGGVQPGCGTDDGCSHARSNEYFAESVLQATNNFLGKQCSSFSEIQRESCTGSGTARMGGEPSNHSVKGIYYLPVNSKYPFATGKV